MKNDTSNQKTSVDTVLAKMGYKLIRNFDFALAGLCLTFALASRPFTTSIYEQPLENAKARYEVVYQQADSVYRAGTGKSAPEDSTLNMYLYDRREQSEETRALSDEFRSARSRLRQTQSAYDFGSAYGYACAGVFAAMGVVAAGAGIAGRRRDKNAPGA